MLRISSVAGRVRFVVLPPRVCRQAQRRHFISSFSVSEGLQGPNTWKPSSLGFSKAPKGSDSVTGRDPPCSLGFAVFGLGGEGGGSMGPVSGGCKFV